jgi:aryl-alcohol dehydrogenase-like predicted oxidoreductase
MRRRTLGRSGISVSELGFGCGPTAGLMLGRDSRAQVAAVGRAIELGINLFDTAASYGAGVSEQNLGAALGQVGGNTMVASKVTLEWEHFADLQGAIRRSVEGSLQRLRRERLDIIHLHNRLGPTRLRRASFGSGAVVTFDDVLGSIFEALRSLRDEGKVKLFGISAFGGDIDCVKKVMLSRAFDVIMLEYNIGNTTAWSAGANGATPDYGGVGKAAVEQGLGVVALRLLGGGALLKGDKRPPKNNLPLVENAIRFALSNCDVSSALLGFSSVDQVEQAVCYAARRPLH